MPKIAKPFDRTRRAVTFTQPSLAKQAFAAECDINNIMKRFEKDGILSHFMTYGGQYGEFTDCPEYHDAMNKITAANEMFLSLPATIRARFAHDPGAFLDFVEKPENRAELVKMGLARETPPSNPSAPREPLPAPPPSPGAPAPA